MNGSNNMMQNQMMGMMNNDIKINFDSSNLIEFISLPIIIKNHHPHPVIYCYTLERKKFGTNWNCNNCCGKYTYDQPSFYCIFCDYDICGNCVENLKINEIKFNDFCKNKTDIHLPSNDNFAWTKKYADHEHLLTHIKRKNENFTWKCDVCYKDNLNKNPSFYCSLCDYNVCQNCFDNDSMNQMRPMVSYIMNPMMPNIMNPMMPNIMNPMMPNIMNPMMPMNPPFGYYDPQMLTFLKWYGVANIENKKPVIYLYPKTLMEISIQLNIKNSKITVVYPKFNEINNTWKVKAEPNGDIIIDDKIYPYLFYELESYVPQIQNEGFIVKDEDAEKFLENKLKILGLNSKESTDFITYWLPLLLKNKISLCTFQNQTFFNNFELNINPKPDTLIRLFLSIKKIENIPDIKEQKLEQIERRGFTVIEWGGSNLKDK